MALADSGGFIDQNVESLRECAAILQACNLQYEFYMHELPRALWHILNSLCTV